MQKVAPFQASKWLEVAALLDFEELKDLFNSLKQSFPALTLFRAGTLGQKQEIELSISQFETLYQEYLESLLKAEPIALKTFFLSCDEDSVFLTEPESSLKVMAKLNKPAVHIQFHRFDYSSLDGKFHSMMHGKDSISFGLHFSYPQLYFDHEKRAAIKSFDELHPNALLFKQIQQWMRKNSVPTPFLVEDKKINATFRTGKKCFDWIDLHPGLKRKNLKVIHAS